jgi:hypothetical protein
MRSWPPQTQKCHQWSMHCLTSLSTWVNHMLFFFIIGAYLMKVLPEDVMFTKFDIYIFIRPVFKTGRILVYHCPFIRPSFHMSRSNLRTPWPIHFKFHRVIEIDSLMVCILFGEISIFHSRVMGLYSSNCRRFFVCRAVNWELLCQFTSNFAQLLELIVLRSVYFLVKFRFFIPELWDFIHQIVGDFSYVVL